MKEIIGVKFIEVWLLRLNYKNPYSYGTSPIRRNEDGTWGPCDPPKPPDNFSEVFLDKHNADMKQKELEKSEHLGFKYDVYLSRHLSVTEDDGESVIVLDVLNKRTPVNI